MAMARKATQTQSKIAMILYGAEGSGKSSLALQLSYFKRADGKPFRVLYIDNENGSVDDFIGRLEDDGIDTNNLYIVYTQSLEEVETYINKVKNNEDFYELDEDGEETDTVVTDSEGNPFRADAIVVDGTSILKLTCQQSLVEFSKKRNAVKATKDGVSGDERTVRIQGAQMELKDYQSLNYYGQNLILDLMACGAHFIVTAREKDETITQKDEHNKTVSIATGKKIPDGFKGVEYNVKTVIRMFKDDDGNYCANISKDRTGVHNNETVEDLSLLDWQVIIDKTKDKKAFVVKNALNQAVETETKIQEKEIDKIVESVSPSNTSESSVNNSANGEIIDKITDIMKSLSVPDKKKAKEQLESKGLPATPKTIKAETNTDTLNTILDIVSKI